MGSTVTTQASDNRGMRELVPNWTINTQLDHNLTQGCISDYSEGFQCTSANTVVRYRPGCYKTDGARWSNGFSEGKHIFEIIFPFHHRGTKASVGVGTSKQPLLAKGKVSLIGSTDHSWGIDLRTNMAIHDGKITNKYPSFNTRIPDNIYMYLNADVGTLQFSSSSEYFGTAFREIKTKGLPLHPMVCASKTGAEITIIYRGSDPISTLSRIPITDSHQLPQPLPYNQMTMYTTPTTYMMYTTPTTYMAPLPPLILSTVCRTEQSSMQQMEFPPPPSYSSIPVKTPM